MVIVAARSSPQQRHVRVDKSNHRRRKSVPSYSRVTVSLPWTGGQLVGGDHLSFGLVSSSSFSASVDPGGRSYRKQAGHFESPPAIETSDQEFSRAFKNPRDTPKPPPSSQSSSLHGRQHQFLFEDALVYLLLVCVSLLPVPDRWVRARIYWTTCPLTAWACSTVRVLSACSSCWSMLW